MISCSITTSPANSRSLMVEITGPLENRRGLNAVLAQRLAAELQDHFGELNKRPNKKGWSKTNFWADIAAATSVGEVTDDRATVTVAEHRYAIHLYGGTIRPTGGRQYLSIPLVEEARGLNPGAYEDETGSELFRLGRAKVLFEKSDNGGQSIIGKQMGYKRRSAVPYGPQTMPGSNGRVRGRGSVVPLLPKQELRAVYALTPQVIIPADPKAFPDMAKLIQALGEEAEDFIARAIAKAKKK